MKEAYRHEKPHFLATLQEGHAWLVWTWKSPSFPSLEALRTEMCKLFRQWQTCSLKG